MARIPLTLPKVGLVMEGGRLVRWLKHVGDEIRLGEPVLELETEKSVIEVGATESGRLTEILLHEDAAAQVGDRLAWLETDASTPPAMPADGAAAVAIAATTSVPARLAVRHPEGAAIPGRISSSPAARRLATEHHVDLRRVDGTGPSGRIQLADVRRAIESGTTGVTHGPQSQGWAPLPSMKRALARAVSLSNATVPQFAVERAVDWTTIQTLRARLVAELPHPARRASINDFLLQAIARALLGHPGLNGTFRGDVDAPDAAIVPARGAHIGLVVAVGHGVLVPVMHHVERMSIRELAGHRADLVDRARNGRLRSEELEGATFSLSNLGASGPDRFNAMINPPQSAILAVGRQRDVLVATQGTAQVRPTSQLTLTVDHRVADGRLASDFLTTLIEVLEGDEWHLS